MHVKSHNLLHWLLVIALAVLPLRAVLAAGPDCDMPMGDSRVMSDHSQHGAGMMHHSDVATDRDDVRHDCCNGDGPCSPDCGMGLHASAIMQSAFVLENNYLPLSLAESSDSLFTRILTPPSRPPLKHHI